MRRYGQVIRLRAGAEAEYRRLHADVWPEVAERLRRSRIANYTIFLHDDWLFAVFEHQGEDPEADFAAMAQDAATQRWWAVVKPLQEPLAERAEGEWWTTMEEVFHQD